jgi:Mg-chelatase subunit ChlI
MPFPAIVGQDELKLGLVLNLIDPGIGGLLIRGPKGTGKSTAVYALARLMPERRVVTDCPYHCDPKDPDFLCESCRQQDDAETANRAMRVVSLPLSTSEDRLVGSVDMGKMLSEGEKAFQPGILAEANGNVLYVDEINLLPDHIADDILDAAASGWSTVEREGFSVTHPARFVLVGTMNPEEGELRPQLLDRLPLSVSLETIEDPEQRVAIITRNLAAARDHDGLREEYADEERELSEKIAAARETLPSVGIHSSHLLATAEACVALGVDGHRPEIVITRTAIALAAFHGRDRVDPEDVRTASFLALGHRTRGGGFEPPATRDEIGKAFDSAFRKHGESAGELILPGVKKKSGG